MVVLESEMLLHTVKVETPITLNMMWKWRSSRERGGKSGKVWECVCVS